MDNTVIGGAYARAGGALAVDFLENGDPIFLTPPLNLISKAPYRISG